MAMDVVEWLRLRQSDPRPLSDSEFKAILSEIEWLRSEVQKLRTGEGKTFKELVSEGEAGGGSPYRFDELRNLSALRYLPTPPLVFIHIPRTAGTTLNKLLMRNYKFRLTSYGAHFFPRYSPAEFLQLVAPPESEDDRARPAFFGGHIDISNEIFRYMPVRYVVVTILRDPVERIVSHYQFNSTKPSVFQKAIREEGLNVIGYLNRLGAAIPQQYQLFGSDVASALTNLEKSVSIFGLQQEFGQFAAMLAKLLGLPDISHKPLNKSPPGAAEVTEGEKTELRSILKQDIAFYEGAVSLYRRRLNALDGLPQGSHPWSRYYA
jgi:hypothetical protein